MYVFSTLIVLDFNKFTSENSSNNRHDYLKIVTKELCLMPRVPAYGNVFCFFFSVLRPFQDNRISVHMIRTNQ